MKQLIRLALTITILLACSSAQAEITELEVRDNGYLGSYSDYEYHWVDAYMHGRVERKDGTTGHYKVPVNLIYPVNKPPRAGFVDLINSASFSMYLEDEAPEGRRVVYRIGETVLADYLRMQGYSYMALQWSKMVTHIKGEKFGFIEDGRDGYEIINDAARYLKAPVSFSGSELTAPSPAEKVISFGFSQTAKLQYSMVAAGLNREPNGSIIYDGMLAGAMGAGRTCMVLNNSYELPPNDGVTPQNPTFSTWDAPCSQNLPADTKYVSLMTQSDVILFGGYLDRQNGSHYRQYELAGISHIPPDNIDFRFHGSDRQNPNSLKPAFRAVMNSLEQWVLNDVEPPPSQYIDVDTSDTDNIKYTADADGNVLGGVRYPHMQRQSGNTSMGAPLGVYSGIDPDMFDKGFSFLGGTFEPFTADKLKARYASAEDYVKRVEGSLDALIDERFLLPDDKHVYTNEARLVGERLFKP